MKYQTPIPTRLSCLLAVIFVLVQSFVPGHTAMATETRGEKRVIDVPFFSQVVFKGTLDANNQPYYLGNSSIPLWSDGCGVASLAMVYQKWGMATCLPCLNEALKESGGFSGALLKFSDTSGPVAKAGAPFIKSIVNIPTSKPRDYKNKVDEELAAGRPVIAFINSAHFVVITGVDENGSYLVNDPWKKNEADGKNIPIEKNLTGLGFDRITQFEFIHPAENAPTNGMIVRGAIKEEYFNQGGSKGVFGNPVSEDTEDTRFLDRYPWQKFEHGAMVSVDGNVRFVYGPLWKKVQELGGLEKTGLPINSQYSYWSGGHVVWTVDLEQMTLKWIDIDPEDKVEILYPGKAIRVEYFPNDNLSGVPIHASLTNRIRSVWGNTPPVPWLNPDQFAIRWKGEITPGFGWFYNFRVQGDGRYRVYLDGKLVLDAWDRTAGEKFIRYLGRGKHVFTVEYAKVEDFASMSFDWSAWPASPVFAAEAADGPVDFLPASIMDYQSETTVEGGVFSEPDQPVHQLMEAIMAEDADLAAQALDPADQLAGKLLVQGFQKATQLKNLNGSVKFDELDYSVSLDGEEHATVSVDGIADFYNSDHELTDSRYFNFEIPVIRRQESWYVSLDLRKAFELLKEYQNSE